MDNTEPILCASEENREAMTVLLCDQPRLAEAVAELVAMGVIDAAILSQCLRRL
jgi:hypothetical protein